MTEYTGMPALAAGLLGAAPAVDHREMSRYGTLRKWAEELGLYDVLSLLETTIKDEDAALTSLPKSFSNVEVEADMSF